MTLRFGVPLTLGLAFVVLAAAPGRSGVAAAVDVSPVPPGKVVPAASLMKELGSRRGMAARGRSSSAGAPRAEMLDVRVHASSLGRSGQLRLRLALPGESLPVPLAWGGQRSAEAWYRWAPVLGTRPPVGPPAVVQASASASSRPAPPPGAAPLLSAELIAPDRPGVYALEIGADGTRRLIDDMRLVVLVPVDMKRNGRINGYHIGGYPSDGRPRYAPPRGFIEVTRYNRDLRISKHFRLRDFLTKDQHDIWPKYLAVDTLLVDKLELVVEELASMGVRAERMHVMSGFRTPQYNRGIGQGRLSRHQFGDAADVWVDNEGDGWMSDLNRDGRVDTADARVILRAVERVERRHPKLVGGAGIYAARPGVRGPFIHIDVRGRPVRW